jgi:hypothetical protein
MGNYVIKKMRVIYLKKGEFIMATKAQIKANRLNAQKATGPRTPEGKAIVSQNAVKHGLFSHQDVISTENQADFDQHRNQMLADLAPVDSMESMLAERIVSLSWRLNRTLCIQNQSIEALKNECISWSFPNTEQLQDDDSLSLILGQTFVMDFKNHKALDRLQMYERRIEHSLYRTILELQKLRFMRKMNRHETDQEKKPSEEQSNQTEPFMRNKPNFQRGKMNVNSYLRKD